MFCPILQAVGHIPTSVYTLNQRLQQPAKLENVILSGPVSFHLPYMIQSDQFFKSKIIVSALFHLILDWNGA